MPPQLFEQSVPVYYPVINTDLSQSELRIEVTNPSEVFSSGVEKINFVLYEGNQDKKNE